MLYSILSFLFITVFTVIDASPIQARASLEKRGVAFENLDVIQNFPTLQWGYNWLSNGFRAARPGEFEYVPMLHSDEAVFTDIWEKDVAASVEAGAKHILSFNEPDQCG